MARETLKNFLNKLGFDKDKITYKSGIDGTTVITDIDNTSPIYDIEKMHDYCQSYDPNVVLGDPITGITLTKEECENYNKFLKLNYKSFMPPNMYGPKDNYDLNSSHFYPALLRKIYTAKIKKKKFLEIWGSGKARRELMFVEDFADAIIFFMNKKIKEPFINIGIGKDYTINWYANFLMKKLNIKLKIYNDRSKPDGMPKKCLDIKLAKKYGWKPNNNFNVFHY